MMILEILGFLLLVFIILSAILYEIYNNVKLIRALISMKNSINNRETTEDIILSCLQEIKENQENLDQEIDNITQSIKNQNDLLILNLNKVIDKVDKIDKRIEKDFMIDVLQDEIIEANQLVQEYSEENEKLKEKIEKIKNI